MVVMVVVLTNSVMSNGSSFLSTVSNSNDLSTHGDSDDDDDDDDIDIDHNGCEYE